MGSGAPISTWAHQELAVAEAEEARPGRKVAMTLDRMQPECSRALLGSKVRECWQDGARGQQAQTQGRGLVVDSFLAGRRLYGIVIFECFCKSLITT